MSHVIWNLPETVQKYAEQFGFQIGSWVPLQTPLTMDFYKDWIESGFHGDMEYLKTHAEVKAAPTKHWPQVKSAIVLAFPYFSSAVSSQVSAGPVTGLPTGPLQLTGQLTVDGPADDFHLPLKETRVALYAQTPDYHYVLKSHLEKIAILLKEHYPTAEFVPAIDTAPLLERDLARQAGIGWVGKNTCMIHPKKGSLFFLANLLCTLPAPGEVQLMHDFCGTCTRCIEVCPTQAIEKPRTLNAQKCISYLTIESKSIAPKEMRSQINDWFFGCDLCQTVCPWNQKIFGSKIETAPIRSLDDKDSRQKLINELEWILKSSGKDLQRAFFGTALLRARPWALKRNALYVIGNQKLSELKPSVQTFLNDPRLGELAQWCLESMQTD